MKNFVISATRLVVAMGCALTMLTSCNGNDENIITPKSDLSKEEMVGMPAKYQGMSRAELEEIRDQRREQYLDSIGNAIKNGTFVPDYIAKKRDRVSARNTSDNATYSAYSSYSGFYIVGGNKKQNIQLSANYNNFGNTVGINVSNNASSDDSVEVKAYAFKSNGSRRAISSWKECYAGKTDSFRTKSGIVMPGYYDTTRVLLIVENDDWWWNGSSTVSGSVSTY